MEIIGRGLIPALDIRQPVDEDDDDYDMYHRPCTTRHAYSSACRYMQEHAGACRYMGHAGAWFMSIATGS